MGKEAASAFGRWFVLNDFPVNAELVAVADLAEPALEWFKQVPTMRLVTTDYKELLADPDVRPQIEALAAKYADAPGDVAWCIRFTSSAYLKRVP